MDVSDLDHARHSVLRELIIEHLFIGEALRSCWRRNVTDVEVLRSETDSFGYDLVVARSGIVRHVQLKSLKLGGRATAAKVGLALAAKPSGCVVWIVVTADLTVDHYLWFGGAPGAPLPAIDAYKIAKHDKGNSLGVKTERPAHRLIPRRRFETISSLDGVLDRLLGQITD